jgi:hypothetical protein
MCVGLPASRRDLPQDQLRHECLLWVGTRRATFLVRRRKPAAQVSHPESCRTPSSAADPERSLRLPQSCRSGTQGFHEFRCSEAAVRDLTHPAISRQLPANPEAAFRARRHAFFLRADETHQPSNLSAAIPVPLSCLARGSRI